MQEGWESLPGHPQPFPLALPAVETTPNFSPSFGICPLWGREEAAFSSSIQLDIWIIFPPFLVSALPSKQNSSGHSQLVENQW